MEIVTVGPSELASTGNTGVPVPLRAETDLSRNRDENLVVVRVNKVSAGGAFGEADFLLGKNHRFVYWIVYWIVCLICVMFCVFCACGICLCVFLVVSKILLIFHQANF